MGDEGKICGLHIFSKKNCWIFSENLSSELQNNDNMGGWYSTEVALALLTQPARVWFSAFPIFSEFLDVAEI